MLHQRSRFGTSRRPHGFTLIELLVVIAIIAILIALLVPAVQKVREAAARTQCINNVKQLGLGLHAYHDTNKSLPAGAYTATTAVPATTPGTTWMVRVLPYVEQTAVYNQYNQTLPYNNAANLPVGNFLVPIYQCPSGSQQLSGNGSEVANGQTNYSTHYYGNMGPTVSAVLGGTTYTYTTSNVGTNSAASIHGPLGVNTKVRLTDIVDGTSNTILVGEISVNQIAPLYPNNGYRSWCRGQNGGAGASKNVSYKINDPAGGYNGSNNFNDMAFASNHTGGCTILLGDGSGRFVSDSVDLNVLKAMASKDGREVASFD